MKKSKTSIAKFTICFLILIALGLLAFTTVQNPKEDKILSYTVDPKKQNLHFYWKDNNGAILKSIQNLKNYVESRNLKLIFAINGGMFNKSLSPLGLFIQEKKTRTSLDTINAKGNFYLKPNGVFYITTDNRAFVCTTPEFVNRKNIKYATQSGPMLVVDGKLHPAFTEGSTNLNIRSGVGVLPNNKIVFAISKTEINFYDFAKYFQNLGCKNALYLDGFVARAYLPEKNWMQLDGNFGVMIGVTEKKKQ